jgi:hypothetical protein
MRSVVSPDIKKVSPVFSALQMLILTSAELQIRQDGKTCPPPPSCRICNSAGTSMRICNAQRRLTGYKEGLPRFFPHYKCSYSPLPNCKFGRTEMLFSVILSFLFFAVWQLFLYVCRVLSDMHDSIKYIKT